MLNRVWSRREVKLAVAFRALSIFIAFSLIYLFFSKCFIGPKTEYFYDGQNNEAIYMCMRVVFYSTLIIR